MAEKPTMWLEGKHSTPAIMLAKIIFASNARAVDQESLASWCTREEKN